MRLLLRFCASCAFLRPFLLVLFAAFAGHLAAQPAPVLADPTTGILFRPTTLSGNTTIASGQTLTLNGAVTGTPTGGTLNLSALSSLTVPSATAFASASATRAALEVSYPSASVPASGNIAVWANSMGTTGSSTPWPYWVAIRTGRPVYNGSVAGETSTEIKTRFDAATDKRGYYTIFDVARNDSSFVTTKSNLAAMIASLGHTRYLVIGVLCRQSTPTGNAQHTLDLALNADLLALYGTRFYDPQSYLVGMWDPNAAQDVTDHSNDVFPSSLEYNSDDTHLNLAGHLVQADRIAPLVLHALGEFTPAFTSDATITKSAPTLSLVNTGAGGATYALANTAAAGQFRITETGVADRFVISKTTGNVGIGTTSPINPFVVSNGGAAGFEFNPSSGLIFTYDRVGGAYVPLLLSGSTLGLGIGGVTKFALDASGNATASGNISVAKSSPVIELANTGAGAGTFSVSVLDTTGQFRITEVGVATRVVIDKTTGNMAVGHTSAVAPFVVSNAGGLGFEVNPSAGGGTQLNLLAYNRVGGAYGAAFLGAASWSILGPISSADPITLSSSSTSGYLAGTEQSSSPAAPSANGFRLYAKDNGSGKTVLYVRFASGAEQQIAIEP
jgi:hypothetical protein